MVELVIKLSDHFTLSEMISSATADRLGIDNYPSNVVVFELERLADLMESIREVAGEAITITSGYRCPELNKAIGGSKTSAHQFGRACDFVTRYGSAESRKALVAKIVTAGIVFDQLILEPAWIHVSIAAEDARPRKQVLRAIRQPSGKMIYNKLIVAK